MPRKRVLVLANSFKHGGRCIAGREIVPDGRGRRLGPWLRPVSDHGHGELTHPERSYDGGRSVRVMDVADVALCDPVRDPCQPENWRIDRPPPFTGADPACYRPPPALLEERPADLWSEPGQRSDRASHPWVLHCPPRQSLYVIRPERFRLHLSTELRDGVPRKRHRCLFRYRGAEYDMGMTDPLIDGRYDGNIPGPGQPPVELRLPCGDDLLVCVSLAAEFYGFHYKVVATVFEGVGVTKAPADARLFTVGHSNHPLETFLALLTAHAITAVADVRSSPFSRFTPQFNRDPLAAALADAGIRYVFLGRELGARREEPECYDDGTATYDRIARAPLFQQGLERIRRGVQSFRVALMCAEKDPLDCHRTVLVCRHLRPTAGPAYHILEDGQLESQTDAEARLLSLCGLIGDDLFLGRDELIEQAYDQRGRRIAYATPPDGAEEATP